MGAIEVFDRDMMIDAMIVGATAYADNHDIEVGEVDEEVRESLGAMADGIIRQGALGLEAVEKVLCELDAWLFAVIDAGQCDFTRIGAETQRKRVQDTLAALAKASASVTQRGEG